MKTTYFKLLIVLLLFININGYSQFKATMLFTANNQQREMEIYSHEGNYRYEFNANGQDGIVISKQGSNQVFILMPQQKMAMKSPSGSEMAMNSDPLKSLEYYQKNGNLKEVGKETINGIKCVKSELWNKTGNEHGQVNQKVFTVWYSEKYQFPIKIINHINGSEDSGMELKDVEPWASDASSFSIPSNYQIMEMDGVMPKY